MPPRPPMTLNQLTVLIVDDEPTIRETMAEFLQREGYLVLVCPTGEDAVQLARNQHFDVILCDVNLPGMDGMDVLERLQIISPDTFVILITAYATVETAVEAFQKGAYDYLIKPIILRDVSSKLNRLGQYQQLHNDNQTLRRALHALQDQGDFYAFRHAAMKQIETLSAKLAPSDSTILILGESGTGKDVLARSIHQLRSATQAEPGKYVPINCAAIPADLLESQLFGHRRGSFTGAERDMPGVFAHAGAGTVFLDEIGELPLATQAKLLRVLEQKEVHPVGASEPVRVKARILAATNKNLEDEVRQGRFRNDLFYRLTVMTMTLPPLRHLTGELPELVAFLLGKHARAAAKPFVGVEHEAMRYLEAHTWPGNIRELDNAIQRAVLVGDPPLLQVADFPESIRPPSGEPTGMIDDLSQAYLQFEKQHLLRVLRETPERRRAARRLGIGLSSLYRKLDEHGITSQDLGRSGETSDG